MLKIRLKKRHTTLIIVATCIVLLGAAASATLYIHNQALAKKQREVQAMHDKQIADSATKHTNTKQSTDQAAKDPTPQKSPAASPPTPQKSAPASSGCAINGAHGDPSAIDVIINKKHCFSPIDFAPGDLTGYDGYLVSSKIIPGLTALFNAAAAAGSPLNLSSTYRSYSNQVTTYNNWVRVNGSTTAADTVSARPGYSEHQTGFALDFAAGGCTLDCFTGSSQYQWMQQNAAMYGFIERYPAGLESITGYSPEAWHWRYVGPETALSMKASGVKTLEQFWGVSGGEY